MSKNHPIILGIDPGARQIGVAVICGDELIYYAVRTLQKDKLQKTVFESLTRIITKSVAEFDVDWIALERVVSIQQRNSFVKTVYRQIKLISRKHHFKVIEYSPKLVRSAICNKPLGTRNETYQILTKKYPELNRYFSLTRIWQKAYFAHLFDAIAVAFLCGREIKESEQFDG